MRIGIVAPSCRLEEAVAGQLPALARAAYGADAPEFVIHPQCFLTEGHFAGPDAARADAFVELANDPAIDAIWFARGGYGACRVVDLALPRLASAAGDKAYLGYSDAGFMLAGLYAAGIGRVAHGPMPSDMKRAGGEAAVLRGLAWLMGQGAAEDGPKKAAFNLTVLSQLLGTALQPDLTDHVLMIEEVGEYMYRIDRSLFHLTSNPQIRKISGLMLGRCSDVPENDPDFVLNEEEVTRHWCAHSGIAYLGRADIGHDAENQVVPFG
ncbi:MAG: LD-carboxypeptidase [Alphaproteobacteria bacterium]|nr:LD-carboxypeptidase [Alphaproteobacteria bacterium]